MSDTYDPVAALLDGDVGGRPSPLASSSGSEDETPAFDVDALAADYRNTDPVVRLSTWDAYSDDERAALADARVPDPFSMFGDEYRSADGASRLQWWTQLTDDQRAELTARFSFTGPLSAMADDRFAPVPPDDARYRSTTQKAKATVTAALAQVRAGHREWSDEFRAEVESLLAEAEMLPATHPDHGHAVQLAAHLVNRAEIEFENAIPMGEPVSTRIFTGADRRTHIIETDSRGKQTETILDESESVLTGADVSRLRGAAHASAAPWAGGDVNALTLDDVAGWSTADLVRLKKEHPQVFETLKWQESRAIGAQ